MRLPRHVELWLAPYVVDRYRRLKKRGPRPTRVWLTIADHFEPLRGGVTPAIGCRRVRAWQERWPVIARNSPRDTANRPPQYTFFYPEEEYRPELVEPLAGLTRAGIADVEVHIHHDREPRDVFIHRIGTFCQVLRQNHGLLREMDGGVAFGFIHGNWALDNSSPDGKGCGLNDEITILRDLGCYADFTMPAGNSYSQARTVNQIYWCTDDPRKPKSYDRGATVGVGGGSRGDLLIISGPLGLRYRDRWLPRMETGEISAYDIATEYRVTRWFDLAPQIGHDLFIKLYAHGALETNAATLLEGGLARLFQLVQEEAAHRGVQFFYATAWQMYEVVSALSAGRDPIAMLSQSSPVYSELA